MLFLMICKKCMNVTVNYVLQMKNSKLVNCFGQLVWENRDNNDDNQNNNKYFK